MTVDELFERNPLQWGLRGDPHAWRAMRAALRGKPLPDDLVGAQALLLKTFRKVVGVEIPPRSGSSETTVFVKKFSVGSGMSDGQVSLVFWRDTAFPILLDRFLAAREHEDVSDRFGL